MYMMYCLLFILITLPTQKFSNTYVCYEILFFIFGSLILHYVFKVIACLVYLKYFQLIQNQFFKFISFNLGYEH